MQQNTTSSHPLLGGRAAVLATMHRKEAAIAPVLASGLGLQVLLPPADFDSDRFGTFTREAPRPGDQLQTARAKARAGMTATGLAVGIASEGSFGPHPGLPFVPANREIVVLIDDEHHLEVAGEAFSTQTNFAAGAVCSLPEALAFAQRAGFPEHGLVVGTGRPEDTLLKGVVDPQQLEEAVAFALARSGRVHLETDMRALYNPTRMGVIAQAARHLVEKLYQFCPRCGHPGYGIIALRRGLPCALCGTPTDLPRAAVHGCSRCARQEIVPRPDGLRAADPAQCPLCNP
ncbi:DUF6671 family protein [Gloeobacter morelensis]|uniref:DUF6671 domain-containing protein n=1 Tax=Gloeobacter morelensis MG652769 TaxID=2781736 RepID=A0ABY3PG81_9CYAN|nr:DUF6671 family protein [Gloeobacter morelensis]UFP92656.1 hypothetical protein ISF26_12465 [Gloeobacter morelensis MG652769]